MLESKVHEMMFWSKSQISMEKTHFVMITVPVAVSCKLVLFQWRKLRRSSYPFQLNSYCLSAD